MIKSENNFYFEYYEAFNFESKNEYLSRINSETNKLRFLFNISEPMALKFLLENKLNLEESINSLFKFFENSHNDFFSLRNYNVDEKNDTCQICLDVTEKRISNNCEHFYCEKCYADYIENSLKSNGFEAIFGKCPEPSCGKILHPNLVEEVLKNRKATYEKYLKNFDICKLNQNYLPISFCPMKDCEFIFPSQSHNSNIEELPLVCPNLHSFCGKCFGPIHKPFSCSAYLTFAGITKNKTQRQNLDWFIKFTTKCPKCFVNIEKNEGCKHMTCRNCTHQFCWDCLKNWVNHSDNMCTKIVKEKQGRGAKKEKAKDEIKLFEKIIGVVRIKPKSGVAIKFKSKVKKNVLLAKNENKNDNFTEKTKIITKTKKENADFSFLKREEEKKRIPGKLDDFKLARILIEIEEFSRIIHTFKDNEKQIATEKQIGKPLFPEIDKLNALFLQNFQSLGEEKGGRNMKSLMAMTLKIYKNFKETMKDGMELGWNYANDSQDIES